MIFAPTLKKQLVESSMHLLILMNRLVLLLLGWALVACDASSQDASDHAGTLVSRSSPRATAACPYKNFDQFLAAFANSIEVQKTHVVLPLESQTVDALAEPEPRPVIKMLGFADLTFPLMPTPEQRTLHGLKQTQTITDATHVEVKLVKPDTDYQLVYLFWNDGCWKLYRMRDDSL